MKVANEDTKFGLSPAEIKQIVGEGILDTLPGIQICGLMAMATNTDDTQEIRKEFLEVKNLFEEIKNKFGEKFTQISMGMSSDYPIAIECGSTIVRIGSTIFGERDYSTNK